MLNDTPVESFFPHQTTRGIVNEPVLRSILVDQHPQSPCCIVFILQSMPSALIRADGRPSAVSSHRVRAPAGRYVPSGARERRNCMPRCCRRRAEPSASAQYDPTPVADGVARCVGHSLKMSQIVPAEAACALRAVSVVDHTPGSIVFQALLPTMSVNDPHQTSALVVYVLGVMTQRVLYPRHRSPGAVFDACSSAHFVHDERRHLPLRVVYGLLADGPRHR